jgi:hypothetical protein
MRRWPIPGIGPSRRASSVRTAAGGGIG